MINNWIEVAAERIRAGEPEREVLADYGYMYQSPEPDCKGCINFKPPRFCLLGVSHCIRRANDFYEKTV